MLKRTKRFFRTGITSLSLLTALGCSGSDGGIDFSNLAGSKKNETTATSDSSGVANISLPLQDITVKLTENGTNQPIPNILVGAQDYNDLTKIIIVDPSKENEFLTSIRNIYPTSQQVATKPLFSINEELTRARGYKPLFEWEETIPKERRRSFLTKKVGPMALADISEFYKEHDDLMNNFGAFEFFMNISGVPEVLQVFIKKANNIRSEFLESLNYQAEWVQEIVRRFGKDYDPHAHYFDVFKTTNPLTFWIKGSIISHEESDDKWCTVRAVAYYMYGNERVFVPDATLRLRNRSSNRVVENIGNFAYFYLLTEGSYDVSMQHNELETVTKTIQVRAPTRPYYTSTSVELETRLKTPQTTSNGTREFSANVLYQNWGSPAAAWWDLETNTIAQVKGEFAPYPFDLWIEPSDPEISGGAEEIPAIIYMGNVNPSTITQPPSYPGVYTSGYVGGKDTGFVEGSVFVARTTEGRFAKIQVTKLTQDTMTLRYWFANVQGRFSN